MIIETLLILVGFVLLIKGADFLVDGSAAIAKKFHIPEIVIGLTIVSIGTSMPELFVSITSALDGHADLALGNVIGSNLCNLLFILGISTMIRSVKFQRETRIIEIPMMLAVTVIFMLMSNMGMGIDRLDGIILIILFIAFILYTIYMAKKGEQFDKVEEVKEPTKKDEKKFNLLKSILSIVLGIVGLKIGGDFVVDNAITIAGFFNISEKIISLTIVAIGTSLPELVTSVTAAIKGDSDIAIGNILGSNIFNILLILGVSSVIQPIVYNSGYNLQMGILVIATLILGIFPYVGKKNEMTRSNGLVYFILYLIYMALLFII